MNRDEGRMNEGDPTMLVGGGVDVGRVCIEEEEEEEKGRRGQINSLLRTESPDPALAHLVPSCLCSFLPFLPSFPSSPPPLPLAACDFGGAGVVEWCHGLQQRHGQCGHSEATLLLRG